MFYDYVCDECGAVTTVKRAMNIPLDVDPGIPECFVPRPVADYDLGGDGVTLVGHGRMRRIYGQHQSHDIIRLGAADYVMKAYRGEELPAGMTQAQVRGIVHGATDHKLRGRANARKYKTLR